jgi:hypothetical protein
MKTKEEKLKEENRRLKKEINNLKLQMRSKETIVKNIIKRLGIIPPYDNFANNLKRINFDDLTLLESKIK